MAKSIRLGVAIMMVLGSLAVGTSSAQTDLSKFPLTKAAPADAFITIAARGNPEQQFLDEYWAGVGQAFLDTGILEDIWDLATEAVPDEKLDQVEEARERIGELLKQVQWGELFHREMLYSARFASPTGGQGLMYEGLLIGRMDKMTAESNYAGLKALLEEIVKMVSTHAGEDALILKESKEDGVPMITLRPAETPVSIVTIARNQELILASFGGDAILKEALALLKGKGEKTSLAETARFKKAFADLPPAEDTLVFWDIEGMFQPMRSIFVGIAGQKKAATQPADADAGVDDAEQWLKLVSAILDELSMADYMASVEWTDGYQVFTETVTAVRSEAKGRPLYEIMTANRPLPDWEKYIPKEADEFSCTSGINLSRLYRYILGFIEKNVPEGKQAIAGLDDMQKTLGVDLDKDILSLFTGRMISAKLGQQQVLLFEVVDEKKANAQIASLIERIQGNAGEESTLLISQVKVAGQEGFTQFSHPLLMMFGGIQPVVGCTDGFLFFGTSTDALAKCMKTMQGKHDNITENERWRGEALIPKSARIDSISFADETNKGAELQQMFGILSMGLNFATFGQGLPPEARKAISVIAPLLSKLATVAGKLDFYQSSAQYTTFDGKQWRQREVQNYKPPTAKSSEEEEDEPDAAKEPSDEREKPAKSDKQDKPDKLRVRSDDAKD